MQKFGSMEKWASVSEGDSIRFADNKPRRVRLQVVSPVGTDWYVHLPDKGVEYFTTTCGMETIEFVTREGMEIKPSGPARYYTSEGDVIHTPTTGNEIFTKIANRQSRNPELEIVAKVAAENAIRRQSVMMAEMEKHHQLEMMELRKAQADAEQPDDLGAGDRGNDETATKQKQTDGRKAPAEPSDKGSEVREPAKGDGDG